MAILTPPPSRPPSGLGDNEGVGRFRMRVTQVLATVVTILVTGWLCTLGVIPAIIGLMTAKHVLVAVLLIGLKVDWPAPRS
jgi:hypothetical protein